MLSGAEGYHQVQLVLALSVQLKKVTSLGSSLSSVRGYNFSDTLVRFRDNTWKALTDGRPCISVN